MSLTEAETEAYNGIHARAGDWPLVGPGDPPPYTIYNEQGDAPFLLVCDHASRAFPRAMNQLGVADWVLDKHVAWDIGSDSLTRHLADRFNARAVMAGYSRLVVDLNRRLDHRSAFIPVSDGIAIPGNLDLSEEEKTLRTRSFFNPYHDAIEAQIASFLAEGRVPAVISIHTCTPVFDRIVRKWHIGVMWDRDPRIALPLLDRLAAMPEVCVGDNEPYSGQHPNDYTIDHHAEQAGLPCVGVEIRQDLVTSEDGARHWAGSWATPCRKSWPTPACTLAPTGPESGLKFAAISIRSNGIFTPLMSECPAPIAV